MFLKHNNDSQKIISMDIFYLKIMEDVKVVFVLVHKCHSLCSVRVSCVIFPWLLVLCGLDLWSSQCSWDAALSCQKERCQKYILFLMKQWDIQITSSSWYLEGTSAVWSPSVLNWCSFCRVAWESKSSCLERTQPLLNLHHPASCMSEEQGADELKKWTSKAGCKSY